jgi:hypothetical protein
MFGKKTSGIVTCVVLVLGLVACTAPAPTEPPTTEPPTIEPVATPEVQTVVVTRMITPTPEPTFTPATPIVVTRVVIATDTPVPPTDTPRPRPRATPTSAGPLDFTHWLGGWSLISKAEDEYEYIIHIEVTGGSPPYVYHHDLETFDIPDIPGRARGCTPLVHTIQVDSADGQSVRRDYWYPAPWCPTPES